MSDPNTPQAAPADDGGDLLDAFLGEEGYGVEDSKQFERRADTDEPIEASADDEDTEEAEAEAAEEGDEEAEVEADEPDGDYVEHEGKKLAVSDLLAAYQFKSSTEAQLDQLRHQVVSRATQEVEVQKQAWTKRSEALDAAYEYVQSLVPDYDRPPASMLDRTSRDYDPDTYHYLNRQIDEIEGRKAQAYQQVTQAREFRKREQAQQRQQAVAQNAAKLAAEFPQWANPETARTEAAKLTTALKQHYGFDDETIASVVDYRFYKLAMDAAAYRASQAKGAPKPKGEAKAAPRLVRSSAKPAPQAKMGKRKATAEAALKKTGKVTDLEATFGDFV